MVMTLKSVAGRRKRQVLFGLLASLVVVGAAVPACADLLTIEVESTSKTTVDGSTLGGLLAVLPFEDFTSFDLTDSSELKNQGVEPEDLESVVLTSFMLSVLSPDDQDLSFFNEVSFFVEAEGLDRVRIAHLDSFPEGVSEVEFDLDDVELVDYAVSESMTISTDVNANVPEQDTELEAVVLFDVTATTTGACKAAREEVQK